MPSAPATIFIVDDDASVRRALGRVMTSAGLASRAFASVEEFLAEAGVHAAGCIVADMTLPGLSGLDLKNRLNAAHSDVPVIFLTAHDTEEMRRAARDAGATGFFRKPVDSQALLDAIRWTSSSYPAPSALAQT